MADYDLNIFQQEVEDKNGNWALGDDWYLDIFVCFDGDQEQYQGLDLPLTFTKEEATKLQLGSGYFDGEDHWYGLEGFLKDYEHQISDRLWEVFNALPAECACDHCVSTDIYSRLYCRECFDQGCGH